MRAAVNAREFLARTQGARQVLVVDLGFLGDSIHLLPALWDVRRNFPAAALHIVSSPLGCEVFRLAACADRCWPLELAPSRRRIRDQIQLIGDLRRQRFDVAINLSAVDRSILLTGLAGARQCLAHLGGREHFWNRWLIPCWVEQQPQSIPVFEQRRQALAAAGFILGPVRFGLEVPPEAVSWAETHVGQTAIHLSLSASTAVKEWPLEHYIQLSQCLLTRQPDWRMVVSSSAAPREVARVQEFRQRLQDERVVSLPPGLELARLAAVLQRCRVHIGPDSGVVHLAMALGVPTVSFFRQRGACEAWMPRGEWHTTFLVPCTCQDDRNSPCQREGTAVCLGGLSPERVAEAVLPRS